MSYLDSAVSLTICGLQACTLQACSELGPHHSSPALCSLFSSASSLFSLIPHFPLSPHSDQPFAPKPSLQLIANYLVVECVRRYPLEKCSLCRETALPEDPKVSTYCLVAAHKPMLNSCMSPTLNLLQNLITDDSHPKYVCRVYCGHLYHQDCLNTYMKTPPFAGEDDCHSVHGIAFALGDSSGGDVNGIPGPYETTGMHQRYYISTG